MTTDRELEQMAADVTFDEWFFNREEYLRSKLCPEAEPMIRPPILVKEAWDYQKQRIDELSGNTRKLEKRIDELENELAITDTMVKAGIKQNKKLQACRCGEFDVEFDEPCANCLRERMQADHAAALVLVESQADRIDELEVIERKLMQKNGRLRGANRKLRECVEFPIVQAMAHKANIGDKDYHLTVVDLLNELLDRARATLSDISDNK